MIDVLQQQHLIDIFLSNEPSSKATCFLVGVNPIAELYVTKETSREELAHFSFNNPLPTLGFLSYNYGLYLHEIPTAKPSNFPLGHLKKYRLYLRYNESINKLECFSISDQSALASEIQSALNMLNTSFSFDAELKLKSPLRSSLEKESYIKAIHEVSAAIRLGDTYQLNLSLCIQAHLEQWPSYTIFRYLFNRYPASYYAYFKSDYYNILSTSPEQFLKVNGGQVSSRPIKGTFIVSPHQESKEGVCFLKKSEKEDAELSMIVDLMRNDLSKHCSYGSVSVKEHKSITQVDHLLQMDSTICGNLKPNSTVLDLLLDAFPGGSVTGFPKKRAMEIIETIEPHTRDIYCGSFFALYDPKNMDSSIAIRTVYWDEQGPLLNMYAGSGITLKSDPNAEYEETLSKLEKFIALFPEFSCA